MPEVRSDPLTGLRTIVAGDRAGRPGAGLEVAPAPPIDGAKDPFAPGHEDRTPPEVWADRPGGGPADSGGWVVRAVPNLYPALAPDAAPPERDGRPELFHAEAAAGGHEVIVNGPQLEGSLSALPAEQVIAAAEGWRARMRAHGDAAHRHLIVNERREAGASLPHTHAQLYALGFVPAAVAREREAFSAHAERTMGGNLLEDVVQEEVRRRVRVVAYDDEAVLLTPYASRVPFQLMLVPRVPRARYEDDGPTGARLLHDGLGRLARRLGAPPPLNLWIRSAPAGAETFCWRIDILPRLAQLAGLELGTGLNLNVVPPERAAAELREA